MLNTSLKLIKKFYKNDTVHLDGIGVKGNVVVGELPGNRYIVQTKVTHDPQGKPHAAGTGPTTDVHKHATEMGLDFSAWPDANVRPQPPNPDPLPCGGAWLSAWLSAHWRVAICMAISPWRVAISPWRVAILENISMLLCKIISGLF